MNFYSIFCRCFLLCGLFLTQNQVSAMDDMRDDSQQEDLFYHTPADDPNLEDYRDLPPGEFRYLRMRSREYRPSYDPLTKTLLIHVADEGWENDQEGPFWRSWARRYPEATTLFVDGETSEEEYQNLAKSFSHIKTLYLNDCEMIDGDVDVGTALFKDHIFSNLEVLVIKNSYMNNESLVDLQNVAHNLPNLTHLDLSQNYITDIRGFSLALRRGMFPKLMSLNLAENRNYEGSTIPLDQIQTVTEIINYRNFINRRF